MYENYEKLRNERGFKDADVARGTGLNKTVFSEWKNGRSNPKLDKIALIAEFLDVEIGDIVGRVRKSGIPIDFNDLVRMNPKIKELIGIAVTSTPEDIQTAITVLKALKDKERALQPQITAADLPTFSEEEIYKNRVLDGAPTTESTTLNTTADTEELPKFKKAN